LPVNSGRSGLGRRRRPPPRQEALGQQETGAVLNHELDLVAGFHRFAGEGHSFTYSSWLEVEQLYLDFLLRTFDLPYPSPNGAEMV
jgi:hypothetical protein